MMHVHVTATGTRTIGRLAFARDLQVSKLIEEGKLKPTLAQTFPLAEAAAAHTLLETGHVRGKVVLDVQEL
jgi:NADPH:quinone reductase-like Zn-dependent oxidoreductase